MIRNVIRTGQADSNRDKHGLGVTDAPRVSPFSFSYRAVDTMVLPVSRTSCGRHMSSFILPLGIVTECVSPACYQAFPWKLCLYTKHYQFISPKLKAHLFCARGTIANVLQSSVSVFQGRSCRKNEQATRSTRLPIVTPHNVTTIALNT